MNKQEIDTKIEDWYETIEHKVEKYIPTKKRKTV